MRRTVLIVDDHDEFRTSARALLEAEVFAVVGEATDGTQAIEAVAALRPAVVLLDVQLPGPDGLAVAEGIAEGPDPPAVVLISSRDAAAYGPRLGRTPARGFIAKSEVSGAALCHPFELSIHEADDALTSGCQTQSLAPRNRARDFQGS